MGIWSHTNHANQHRIDDSPAPAIDSIYCVCRVEFISAYHFLSPVSTVVAVVAFFLTRCLRTRACYTFNLFVAMLT